MLKLVAASCINTAFLVLLINANLSYFDVRSSKTSYANTGGLKVQTDRQRPTDRQQKEETRRPLPCGST